MAQMFHYIIGTFTPKMSILGEGGNEGGGGGEGTKKLLFP